MRGVFGLVPSVQRVTRALLLDLAVEEGPPASKRDAANLRSFKAEEGGTQHSWGPTGLEELPLRFLPASIEGHIGRSCCNAKT